MFSKWFVPSLMLFGLVLAGCASDNGAFSKNTVNVSTSIPTNAATPAPRPVTAAPPRPTATIRSVQPTSIATVAIAIPSAQIATPSSEDSCELPRVDYQGNPFPEGTDWVVTNSFLVPVMSGGYYRGVVLYDFTGSHIRFYYVEDPTTHFGVFVTDAYVWGPQGSILFNLNINGTLRVSERVYVVSCLGLIFVRGKGLQLSPIHFPSPTGKTA